MKHVVILILGVLFFVIKGIAQDTSDTKILVFRNTGEINVFHTNEISHIQLSTFDNDSIEHEDFVTQVFYKNDSVFTSVPIVEIDSVAFGVRNIIEPKLATRRLTDVEASKIKLFDNEMITYSSDLKLEKGEIIFYDRITDVMPYGLCAKILDVSPIDEGMISAIDYLDPKEVFDRYVITDEKASDQTKSTRIDYEDEPFKIELPEMEMNGYKFSGYLEVKAELNLEDGVCDLVNDYLHGIIKLIIKPEIQFSVTSEDSNELNNLHGIPIRLNIPFFGGALSAGLELQLFSDFKAEAGVEYNFNTELFTSIEWTRNKGKNEFGPLTFNSSPSGDYEQKIEVHLNGELFFGPILTLRLGALFNRLGAGLTLKVGPKFNAEFSLGVLQELSEKFSDEAYAKAQIGLSVGAKMETFTYYLDHFLFGDELHTKLPFESEIFIPTDIINIFPEFHSRAVMSKESTTLVHTYDASDAVSVSTYTETELPRSLDIDFEIADKDTENIVANIDFEDVFQSSEECTEDFQNLNGEIPLTNNMSQEQKENLIAYPVINYLGYRVKANPIDVASDMVFAPIVASMNSRGAYFVSGMPMVSQHDYEETTYIEGNQVGVMPINEKLQGKRTFSVIDFVDMSDLTDSSGSLNRNHPLLGQWSGVIFTDKVSMHFIDEKTGRFNGEDFTYTYDSPLKGGIAIKLLSGSTISFSVVKLDPSGMTIVPKGSDKAFFLAKE